MKKTTSKMMVFVSVNYESAFWKWKYIVTKTGFQTVPKHSLAFKRFILIGTNYQQRLQQYSFYKVALYYRSMLSGGKLSFPQKIAHMNKYSRDFSQDDSDRPLSNLLNTSKSDVNPSSITQIATNKLSKEEVTSLNQAGAFELMASQIKSAKARRTSWALAFMIAYSKQISLYDTERTNFIEQINELRFEKHSLLEDNTTLRHHNEVLIENLEKANTEFHSLSLNLDNMRLVRMVRVVSKMIEIPIAEAFMRLYDY